MSEKLTARERAAVYALAQGADNAAAAAAAGVTERTIRRYLEKPRVVAALRAAEQEKLGGLARQLTGASEKALAVLVEVLEDPAGVYSASARIRAAALVLQHRAAFYELVDLSDRLAALEDRLDKAGHVT